jgi:CheY-like chemotaxis protein
MTRVLVVEFDEATRDTLHEMLAYAGHDVVAATMDPASLTCLAACPDRLVVLCSNKHADHHLSASFFAHVAVDARLATQHQYILLSSNPATIPPALATHLTQLGAPVIPKPFDMDALLAAVAMAAERLTPAPISKRRGA